MKYVCMGYHDERAWSGLTEAERIAFLDECSTYAERLRAAGNLERNEALDESAGPVTVRYRNGKVQVNDGPLTVSREQLGGLLFLEAKDMDDAIRLISNHPGVRGGPFEIRPVSEFESGRLGARAAGTGDQGTFSSGGDRRST